MIYMFLGNITLILVMADEEWLEMVKPSYVGFEHDKYLWKSFDYR